ncbi:hypothetical protein A2U01_0058241, partial [Trifolium medium]|nr:hypothetical protein [Trifolium medium]
VVLNDAAYRVGIANKLFNSQVFGQCETSGNGIKFCKHNVRRITDEARKV